MEFVQIITVLTLSVSVWSKLPRTTRLYLSLCGVFALWSTRSNAERPAAVSIYQGDSDYTVLTPAFNLDTDTLVSSSSAFIKACTERARAKLVAWPLQKPA